MIPNPHPAAATAVVVGGFHHPYRGSLVVEGRPA